MKRTTTSKKKEAKNKTKLDRLNGADVSWPNSTSTITAGYAAVYDGTPATEGDRPPVGYIDFREAKSTSMVTAIEYFDKDRKQRWGVLHRKKKGGVVVKNIFKEKIYVPQEKVLSERSIDQSKWELDYIMKL